LINKPSHIEFVVFNYCTFLSLIQLFHLFGTYFFPASLSIYDSTLSIYIYISTMKFNLIFIFFYFFYNRKSNHFVYIHSRMYIPNTCKPYHRHVRVCSIRSVWPHERNDFRWHICVMLYTLTPSYTHFHTLDPK